MDDGMLRRRPGTTTPVDWARLRRACNRATANRVADDIAAIDQFVGSVPVGLLPVDTANLRVRLGAVLECHEYKQGSVVLAAGRTSAGGAPR